MAKIEYTLPNGKIKTFEVDEHTALSYAQIEKETRREEERTRWRKRKKLNSLEEMTDFGVQFKSNEPTPEELAIHRDESRRLHNALSLLPENQQKLVFNVYFNGQSLTEIAKQEGVSYQAIQNRMAKILKNLKLFWIKGVVIIVSRSLKAQGINLDAFRRY